MHITENSGFNSYNISLHLQFHNISGIWMECFYPNKYLFHNNIFMQHRMWKIWWALLMLMSVIDKGFVKWERVHLNQSFVGWFFVNAHFTRESNFVFRRRGGFLFIYAWTIHSKS